MPRVYVEFAGLNQIGTHCKSVASKVDAIQEDFQRTVRQLDWDVRYESDINSTAQQIVRKLEQQTSTMETYQKFLNEVYHNYVSLDEYGNKKSDVTSSNITSPEKNIEVEDVFDTGKKVWKTVTTTVKGRGAVAGCTASWIATAASGGAGTPVALLSTGYAVNTVHSCYSDIKNLWWGDESQVGEVNWLKDTLIENTGDLSEMLGVDRDVGELVGKGIYAGGDIITTISNLKNLKNLPKNVATLKTGPLEGVAKTIAQATDYNPHVLAEDQMKNAAISRMNLNLKDRITQNDTTFETVKKAVQEVPKAISGLSDIAFKSPISSITKDYALLSYNIENLEQVVGMTKLLQEVADVTYTVTENVLDMVLPSK